ncbi:MAG: hypothetical protein ACYC8W_04585 [Candidatus Tyrphobacter sp.]
MSPGLWLVVGATASATLLVAIGGVRLALEARRLGRRAASLSLPAIDFSRARATLAKLQRDAVKANLLIVRAQIALRRADDGVRAMIRAFAGG